MNANVAVIVASLRSVFSLALTFTAFGIAAGGAVAADVPQIRVLSNRADLVSGGDALVEIVWPGGLPPASVRVDVNGRDVTEAFGVRPNARYVGPPPRSLNGDQAAP